MVRMEWCSKGKEVIRPEMARVDLPADRAVVCFTEGFYPKLVKAMGLTGRARAPHIPGFQKGVCGDGVALFKSEMGAPAASMALEVLIASGARRILMLGVAGSLSPSCPVGSFVVPTWGVREEGTSYHYIPSGMVPRPSPSLVRELKAALSDLEPRLGGVWSTDAPYRETVQKVRSYARKGVLVVDMETTALMAVSMRRRAEFAAVLTISDTLYGSGWDPAFGTRKLNRARDEVCAKAASLMLR